MKRLLSSVLFVVVVPAAFADSNSQDDPSKWTPIKIQDKQAAPEFEEITAWVNSKPLTMKELRGKVVVVHFMAFG